MGKVLVGQRCAALLVAAALASALFAFGSSRIEPPNDTEAGAAESPSQSLPSHCSHITILDGEMDRHQAKGVMFEDTVTLESPGPFQLAATRSALSRMTPMVCQSVGRITFIDSTSDSETL